MQVVQSRNTSVLQNQWHHWMQAASRLSQLENLASSHAWNGVDRGVRETIVKSLNASIKRLVEDGRQVEIQLNAGADYNRLRRSLLTLRERYLATETTVHFFTDALNSRTNPSVAAKLRACDVLCRRSMEALLPQLGKEVPLCFTYLDRGLGASILKSGLRLWDGSVSTVAAIKITFHNLLRPTAAIHETGHQVAHILHWNNELALRLRQQLGKHNAVVADVYAGWASEMAADSFAFAHTGYAAVASLHNVIAGTPDSVFTFHEGDPHPVCWLRLLLNTAFARKFYGKGPWDELENTFREDYNIDRYNGPSVPLIKACEKVLEDVVDICLTTKHNAFGGKTLTDLVNPSQVSPTSLEEFERTADTLQQSHAWMSKECLRMLALSGYKIASADDHLTTEYSRQEKWMWTLGIQQD